MSSGTQHVVTSPNAIKKIIPKDLLKSIKRWEFPDFDGHEAHHTEPQRDFFAASDPHGRDDSFSAPHTALQEQEDDDTYPSTAFIPDQEDVLEPEIEPEELEGDDALLKPDEGFFEDEFQEASGLALPTVEEIEAIQRQAYEDGLRLGRQAGEAEGRAEYDIRKSELDEAKLQLAESRVVLAEREKELLGKEKEIMEEKFKIVETVRHLESLFDALSHPFNTLDEEVERQLIEFSMLISRHVLRQEIRIDPHLIQDAVHEAIHMLPINSRAIRIHLHPEDAEAIRESLTLPEDGYSWQIMPSPALNRGDCKVTTESSTIDTSLESRLNAVIEKILSYTPSSTSAH